MTILSGPLLQLLSGSLTTVWLVAVIFFLVVEALVPGLISIWFAAGALAAMFSAMFGAALWLQLALFVLVSAVALAVTRPLAARFLNARTQATNADRLIGKPAVVTEAVNNLQATGAVKIDGRVWTARSADDAVFNEGSIVKVVRIEGVKLIVQAAD